jgi:hypothetical protein
MNKINQMPQNESIEDILQKYMQRGMTPEVIAGKWSVHRNSFQTMQETEIETTERVKLYFEKLRTPRPMPQRAIEVFRPIDYDEAKDITWDIIVKKLGGNASDFSKEGNVTEVIPKLIHYFIKDPASVYPLSKGIYLWGDTGSGKTFLMETMQSLVQILGLRTQYFDIYNVLLFNEQVLNEGKFNSEQYLKRSAVFDDFGQEEPYLRVFNNDIRPMHHIINRAYDNYKRNGQLIHFTSMLPPNLLHETTENSLPHIDRRTYERICDMTTCVKLTGKSKRKFL